MWAKIELALRQHTLSLSLEHFPVADRLFGDNEGGDVLWVWDRELLRDVVTFEIWDAEENTVDVNDDVDRRGWVFNLDKLT